MYLYNSYGVAVRSVTTSASIQMNVSNLPIGIYYLHIHDGISETPEIKQIIIE
jgi:hypothetical protein